MNISNDLPQSPALTDEQLAVAAQGGCRASFEQIVARMHGPLLGYLRRLAASREDAEDLVQETLVRAYRKLDRFRTDWRLSTWLFTIARRLWVNHRRKWRIQSAVDANAMDSGGGTGKSDPAAALIGAEERQQLWRIAAKTLNEPQYTALWLFYVEGMPVAEIGRVLRRSTASVKAVMFRARRRLLAALSVHPRPDSLHGFTVAGSAPET